MKKSALLLVIPLLMACGTKKAVVSETPSTQPTQSRQDSELMALRFVQKVYDNQVYAKDIVGSLSFNLQAGNKDVSVPGSLHMRKDKVIRLQLFIPILGSEVGRLEFTPDYVLIVDRMHKEYIKTDYSQIDFLVNNGLNFYSLQALFWNQLLLPGAKSVGEGDLQRFTANLEEKGQQVPVTLQSDKMQYQWKADKNTGQIGQAIVSYSGGKTLSTLQWDYSNFKSVGVKLFPAYQSFQFSTNATQRLKQARVTLEMKDVKTDDKWDEQTTVSSKYQQVSPKDVLGKLLNM